MKTKTIKGIVKMHSIVINPDTYRASLVYETKTGRQRKFRTHKLDNVVVTKEVMQWFTLKSSNGSTEYTRYLYRMGFPKETKFRQIEFCCDNTSDKYDDNPFRLFVSETYKALSLVNVPSKKPYKTKEGMIFFQKYGKFPDGKTVKAFHRPSTYRRLVIAETEAA